MVKYQLIYTPGYDVSGPAAAADDAAQRGHRLAILAPRHGRIGGQDGRARRGAQDSQVKEEIWHP